jgi:S1-C subfamily serine protease
MMVLNDVCVVHRTTLSREIRMTQSDVDRQTKAPKLLAARSAKVRIAVASGVVLALGALLAPRVVPAALSNPQEHAAPLLEEQVQLREVVRPFAGVQDVAARVRDHSVSIRLTEPQSIATRNDFSQRSDDAQPAGFGVFVADTYVLTHASALDGRSSTAISTADGRTLDAAVAAYDPATALVLLRTMASGVPAPIFAPQPPDAGALTVAVGRWDARDIAVPVFVTSVSPERYRVGAVDDGILSGIPLYTLDGELFGIAATNEGEGHAFPVREAASRLIARASAGERLASLGLGFQDLHGLLTQSFGDQGVLINDVVDGGPADVAGLQTGDALTAVDDAPVSSADDLARALSGATPGAPVTLRFRRAGRVRSVEATPALAYEVAALTRGAAENSSAAPEARVLFSPQVLERAGIAPNARVLSVNGRPAVSRAQVQRELRSARRPVPVLLQHGTRRLFAAIEPAP